MRNLLTPLFLLMVLFINAQTTADFENFGLSAGEFLNNSSPDAEFATGNLLLANDYNSSYDSWTGWAISAATDTLTPGLPNQFSAMPGKGVDNSIAYGVGFSFSGTVMKLSGPAVGGAVEGLYITNSAYPYYSMLEGDSFAKKFGGETGDDPDFFLLTIKKYLDGELSIDSVDFYLADYRFEDNTQDYIVKDWNYIDLSSLGNADSLLFSLSSSDANQFGMNTPAYFCIDNVTTTDIMVSTNRVIKSTPISVYPNPVNDQLFLELPNTLTNSEITIFSVMGNNMVHRYRLSNQNSIDLKHLNPGMYWLRIVDKDKIYQSSFIKQPKLR